MSHQDTPRKDIIKSPVSSPTSKDCDPQKNVLMKRNGVRGVIVAVVVTTVAFIIILISKWAEVRQQRVPFIWRSRLKSMIQDCATSLKLAHEATVPGTSYKHAVEANSILTSAKKLVGTGDLSKMSGYDISKLESEIEALLRRNIPNSLLLDNNHDSKKSEPDPVLQKKFPITQGPKQIAPQQSKKGKMGEAAEVFKIQYEDMRKQSAR